jgi:hypothetical protein
MVRLRFHLANRYEHKAGGRSSSFLDKNLLETKGSSVP